MDAPTPTGSPEPRDAEDNAGKEPNTWPTAKPPDRAFRYCRKKKFRVGTVVWYRDGVGGVRFFKIVGHTGAKGVVMQLMGHTSEDWNSDPVTNRRMVYPDSDAPLGDKEHRALLKYDPAQVTFDLNEAFYLEARYSWGSRTRPAVCVAWREGQPGVPETTHCD